jgi:hypothetical protein
MGSVKKHSIIISFTLLSLLMIYLACRSFSAINNDYSWSEMDWDGSGSTSIFEFFMASDVGKRVINLDDKECQEYFSYKDGLTLKTVCWGESG